MKRLMNACLLSILLIARSARAGTKEDLMRLQNDISALQNRILELQKIFDEKTDGLKSLVVQLNDQVGQSNLILNKVTATLESQASGANTSQQTVLQEIRSLSGKVDEQATSISVLVRQMGELKVQSKSLSQETTLSGPSSSESTYTQAFNDYVQGNFDLAIQGFTAYLGSSPNSDKAADAQYYMGDTYLNQEKLPQAISAFTRVVDDHPDSDKMASALYKRARAELDLQETEKAISDFTIVIEKFQTAPESDLAKAELQKLGVGSKPAARKR